MPIEFFFRTPGEAFTAMVQWVKDNCLSTGATITSISGFYNQVAAGTPAYFVLTTATPTDTVRFYTLEPSYGSVLPLQYAVRQTGMSMSLVCTYLDPGGGVVTLHDCFVALFVSKVVGIAYSTGCGNNTYGIWDLTIPGKAAPCATLGTQGYWNDSDIVIDNDVVINNAYGTSPYEITLPANKVFPVGQYLIPGGGSTIINTSPPMDLDVSINQGQAILSVLSRTTTMLP